MILHPSGYNSINLHVLYEVNHNSLHTAVLDHEVLNWHLRDLLPVDLCSYDIANRRSSKSTKLLLGMSTPLSLREAPNESV